MTPTAEHLSYRVPDVSCSHCRAAITGEVEAVSGVASVDVDLEGKRVTVTGERLDDAAVRAGIGVAGYNIA